MQGVFQFVSRVLYVLVTFALMALAVGFIAYAAWDVYRGLSSQDSVLPSMLHAVGLIIIALAVSDVGKFLLEEELSRERELETTSEIRRTLTKFLTIIIIAASLETLVFLFEAGRERIESLVYPSLLLAAVAILVAVLGVYQRLVSSVEHESRRDLSTGPKLDPEKVALEREENEDEPSG